MKKPDPCEVTTLAGRLPPGGATCGALNGRRSRSGDASGLLDSSTVLEVLVGTPTTAGLTASTTSAKLDGPACRAGRSAACGAAPRPWKPATPAAISPASAASPTMQASTTR